MQTIHAVIFDLDDTLYPERAYAFSGFAAVAEEFKGMLGDPSESEACMRRLFDSEHRRQVFNTLLEQLGLPSDEELVGRMVETYRNHQPTIALHPDADRVLTLLRDRFKLGLITDGPPQTQWSKVDALGLRGRVDEIIVTSDLGPDRAKPHPLAFELMALRLGVEPARCVYVADNPAKDFIAPNALGWMTVQILRPDGIYPDTPPPGIPGATHTIDSLDGIEVVF